MKTKLFLFTLMFTCLGFSAQAQSNVDKQLQRDWFIQSAKQTTYKNAEKVRVIDYQKAELLQENKQIPQGLILLFTFERTEKRYHCKLSIRNNFQ